MSVCAAMSHALLLLLVYIAWVNGNPMRVVYPVDSKGRLCGVDSAVRDKPNLLFFDLTRCIQIINVGEIISGNFDASSIFTCPTPQASSDIMHTVLH